ncbi:MFS transporter [Candidatus Micrarchaeota archaeon]|nr:MFS transporter [Candidatus Micrarchaeota archaeon]
MSFKDVLKMPGIPAVLFTQFMVAFGFGIILPILPFYTLSLGAQPFELGLLTSTFALMSLVFSPMFGKLSDRIGRKKVMLMGIGGFFLAYLVFAVSDSLWMAFLARGIEGVAAGAIFPACISLLSDLTTPKQRGPAMGLFAMMFSLGFILGPAVGGIASAVSVQTAFLLAAGLTVLNLISVHLQLTEPKTTVRSTHLAEKEMTLLQHLTSPFLFLFLSAFMITFMIGGIDAVLALYTSARLGFQTHEVGLVFAFIGAMILVMQFVTGGLVNRFGEIKLVTAGLFLSGVGFFFLQFAHDWPTLLLPLAIFVSGNALVFPSVTSMLSKLASVNRGAVMGLAGSFNSLGMVVGPLFAGFLYGLMPTSAFWGMAAVIVAYAVFFALIAVPRLSNPAKAT